jgi:hypothetical protein
MKIKNLRISNSITTQNYSETLMVETKLSGLDWEI